MSEDTKNAGSQGKTFAKRFKKGPMTQNHAASKEESKSSDNQDQQTPEHILQVKVDNLEKEKTDLNNKNLRLLAEIDNLRRRSSEELEKSAKYAISNFASDLVSSVENFFLASANAPKEEISKNAEIKNYALAIEMTEKELMKVLNKHGIKRIFPLNEDFDHNFHEAISRIESDLEENKIAQVIQAGYSINERLIRPALVAVSKAKS